MSFPRRCCMNRTTHYTDCVVKVGMFPSEGPFVGSLDERRQALEAIEDAGIYHAALADHVSFRDGSGYDGLVGAAAMLHLHPTLPVYVALYILPLRHPTVVARQLATLAQLAPGRLTFGVGVGGDDRHEMEVC